MHLQAAGPLLHHSAAQVLRAQSFPNCMRMNGRVGVSVEYTWCIWRLTHLQSHRRTKTRVGSCHQLGGCERRIVSATAVMGALALPITYSSAHLSIAPTMTSTAAFWARTLISSCGCTAAAGFRTKRSPGGTHQVSHAPGAAVGQPQLITYPWKTESASHRTVHPCPQTGETWCVTAAHPRPQTIAATRTCPLSGAAPTPTKSATTNTSAAEAATPCRRVITQTRVHSLGLESPRM